MKLLVTGGTVFASRYTAEYFSKLGHSVYVLNRGNKPQSQNVTPIIADRHSLGEILKPLHFDAVIDVTAYNADDINSLIDGLGSFDKYIFISSSAVYPETLQQPFCETMETGPNSIWGNYGKDKIEAEKALLDRVQDACIIRPPYLCGPMNNLYREAFVFECAEQDIPFYLPEDSSMKIQFFHIGDLCRLIEKILITDISEHIINTGYPVPISIKEWVTLCYETVGKTPVFKYVSSEIPQRSYFPFYKYEYTLSVNRMSNIIDGLTPLKESLKSSYEWFINNRDLIVRKPLIDFIDKNL
ncbi:NAD-dependent epimerase/dehydratase family protein [Ruminococcus flavefaciens]|uniref:Nucleoside-diphosphate-sugar epimerase n=1 Tax=Ruminococcus flavefaciens TaxID=1265 RepID=A0A1M7H406_RUMFL|nr:NAD-dependent epimerase/dehydratase family protein [Ruminococcus flavefaciens]SHM23362.1 Nucleoside-diphosphate-sugar epimerase [Ruminococcus flavefaciens]